MTNNKEDKIRGAIYGALLGDAVGVPYEFKDPSDIPLLNRIDILPPPEFQRTYPNVPIGTWSDDGSLMLCLLDSLVKDNPTWQHDFINNMINWRYQGLFAVDGKKFDIGLRTAEALSGLDDNRSAYLVRDQDDSYSNGNGSLMRTIPIPLYRMTQVGIIDWLDNMTIAQSMPTHNHPVSLACCIAYNRYALKLLNQPTLDLKASWQQVMQSMQELAITRSDLAGGIKTIIEYQGNCPTGTGYVVDTLFSAVHVLTTSSSYKETIQKAIALGHDTDTTACVAGGLAGIVYGYSRLPEEWISQLRGRKIVDPLVDSFILKLRIINDTNF